MRVVWMRVRVRVQDACACVCVRVRVAASHDIIDLERSLPNRLAHV